MKGKNNFYLYIVSLFLTIIFTNCVTTHQNGFSQFNFSLRNTLSIFLLNNEKGYYFCIPVQYMGDYQISRFEFKNGNIQIGGYNILLKKEDINISVYLNEKINENGSTVAGFNQIYLEENGKVLVSKTDEPLTKKNEFDNIINHYYIFIEKHLTNNEMKAIIKEYERGNVYSMMEIWYDLTIDNEEQNGSGMLDEFEIYDGLAVDPVWFPQNLNFFKDKYLKK
jgi:hypothetical protein